MTQATGDAADNPGMPATREQVAGILALKARILGDVCQDVGHSGVFTVRLRFGDALPVELTPDEAAGAIAVALEAGAEVEGMVFGDGCPDDCACPVYQAGIAWP